MTTRISLDINDPDFLDPTSIDQEMRRQLDVCHGCRRCFNLCDAFPTLFDLIDTTESGELEDVNDFDAVVDGCTLCDMCYIAKCPYVPPHPFNIDIPHLMARYKAYQYSQNQVPWVKKQLAQVDRNAKMTHIAPAIVNKIIAKDSLLRSPMEKITGIHEKAALPSYAAHTLTQKAAHTPLSPNPQGIAYGEKVVIYATCYGNYHDSDNGWRALDILSYLGVDVVLDYGGCCGMPQFEIGNLKAVQEKALRLSKRFDPYIQENRRIISLVPSCSFMLKSEWQSLCPTDPTVKSVAEHTADISEYLFYLFKTYGVPENRHTIDNNIVIHMACHSRAQNNGYKIVDCLKLLLEKKPIGVIERCSGHGGTWGMMKDHFDTALAVGKPVVTHLTKQAPDTLYSSECPLAAKHIEQGLEIKGGDQNLKNYHPLHMISYILGLEPATKL